MPEKDTHEARVSAILKSEIKLAEVTYAELAKRLTDMGIPTQEPSVRNKLSRGKFSAAFMLQCLEAIEVKELRLSR